ncbi:hypothetical protein CSC66_09455 [Pseudoxanthomonas kaohsiungensis]|nr:hypothetical protein CSC66_09455 [Pseudoxanthomonas kaohsiungensis]
MREPELASKIPGMQGASALCDKWIPVPQPAGWCETETDGIVQGLLIDAARLQEGGFSVSAEVLARSALGKAGESATPAARALASAFIDMYKPTTTEASDAADVQFNEDLKRYWTVWEAAAQHVQTFPEQQRSTAELFLKGTLYRDQVAIKAGKLVDLTPAQQAQLDEALQTISDFHESEGR